MLVNIQTQSKALTYTGCNTQMCFFLILGELDNFLLDVMAYDRYVAICHPLHYTAIMTPQLCGLLVLVCWILSVLHALLQSLMVLRLSFCTHFNIPHFFCELNQVIQLAYSDTFLNDVVMHFTVLLLATIALAGVLLSYSKIVTSICAISISSGQVQSLLHLCFSPLRGLLILLHRPRCVPPFCCDPKLTFDCNSLSDVHCGHPHAEPLHLQSEE
ncbi:Olfactory receptor 7A10 [Sciurus carolinensis]|uniref:Olfactory receptor 7A10 n=1 Tax=Sciurus carolinensis TaxID=30640 RepID=A0AA41T739_SCICA|nr:Olfactory receptor 7A10 [Sciurus carolinensis]